MAYKEHGMWEVLDVLKRVHRGEGRRQIARATGRSRKTIGRYVAAACELGWVSDAHEPDEDLAVAVLTKLRPGPKDVVADSEEALQPHLEKIRAWLAPHDGYKRGLKLTKVRALLERRGTRVSYSALYRFAKKHLDFGRRPATVRVADTQPGEVAEIDFGQLGFIIDPETQKRRAVYALIITLVFSRHQYVHITHSQKLDDVIDGVESAWEFFGGVTSRVIVDNMKAAVVKADRYEPVFQRVFNEYAEHRGFIIDAAVARHATGKPHVERQVQYVRDNFFRGEEWLSAEHIQREARRWCRDTAGARIHGTTRQQPLAQFEAYEKAALKPLSDERFDTPRWAEVKVHPDQHVRVDYALYSVPYRHGKVVTRGQTVTVRADRRLVRIYLRGELIKTHPKKPRGARSTDFNDYPAEKTEYAMRDADYLIRRARGHGDDVGRFVEHLLAGDFPWAMLRQAQALMRYVDKYGKERVNEACRRALIFELLNVKRVEIIILQGLKARAKSTPQRDADVVQLPLKFLRAPESLNHNPSSQEKEDHGNPTLTQDRS